VQLGDSMAKDVTPSIKETAFSCPHCSAFTTQYWFSLYANQNSGKNLLPLIPDEESGEFIKSSKEIKEGMRKELLDWLRKMNSGYLFLYRKENAIYCRDELCNLYVSKCFNCENISVWVHDRLIFPRKKASVQPNIDLPDDIKHDFEEAREIVDASPRGAAALLRLCIQKLCMHLGEKGKNIDEDIGSLVKKGLNPLVQQSLDIVRVVGNEALHPGVLDLKDDRDTAMRLFELINAIVEQMISHPYKVQSMYKKLPEKKRKAIEKRDKKT